MWLAVHERLFFLVKFWSKIWLRFPGWELHWLLNEDHTYLLWSGVMELSCMSAKLVSVVAPRSWKSAFLDSSLPPTCTHTHRAPELLKVETLTPKGHLFFSITVWQMTTKEMPSSGERHYELHVVLACHLCSSLSAAVFTDSIPGEDLRRPSSAAWRSVCGSGHVPTCPAWL